ncbi:SDR family oxidoreductase [Catenuloplanes indicus]|uniref:NAD(P)-dependent dehydrogenase (Short-subunit alcohol dehydrogenase family) n=1 Tax=Catenuloplanes indicus TaxID=137267 RepID=A0AAE3W964_9ACTN|nr:SDR family oxidoreductase [Catenuloplanes indicus]MDQ0370780.1 NAD(P)-dependent dehydrogenase (short-subunit alcohol dehydrogenase family) [Catenuloplanes indicus]
MSPRKQDITIPDMSAKRVLVTGASDGMGLVIARTLAAAGAEVIMPVRNRRKGEAAITTIRDHAPRARLELRELDLSSLESVSALGEQLRAEAAPIHVLINNAGIMTPPSRQLTRDRFEVQFGTNHLGHFALVAHLLPLLRQGKARVVSQTSASAQAGGINWDDLNWERSYSGSRAYAQSKIAVALFGLELDRRSKANRWGITSNVSHPGLAPTSLLAARPEVGRARDTSTVRMIRWMSARGILVGTVESAGQSALYAATAPEIKGGEFVGPGGAGGLGGPPRIQRPYRPFRDQHEVAQRLWTTSEELTGTSFPS